MKCLVCNCCLPTYKAIHREHMLHCYPNFVPGLLQYGDTYDIAALIAPRPLHMNFGELDAGSPIDEVRIGVQAIAAAYAAANAPRNFSHFIEQGTGHVFVRRNVAPHERVVRHAFAGVIWLTVARGQSWMHEIPLNAG